MKVKILSLLILSFITTYASLQERVTIPSSQKELPLKLGNYQVVFELGHGEKFKSAKFKDNIDNTCEAEIISYDSRKIIVDFAVLVSAKKHSECLFQIDLGNSKRQINGVFTAQL